MQREILGVFFPLVGLFQLVWVSFYFLVWKYYVKCCLSLGTSLGVLL